MTVCGAPGAGAPTTDLTWALILALARHVPAQEQGLREGRWQAAPPGLALEGATLGVIGLGRLGSRVAALGAGFGMRVLAWSPNLTLERARAAGAELAGREELLRTSDVLAIPGGREQDQLERGQAQVIARQGEAAARPHAGSQSASAASAWRR